MLRSFMFHAVSLEVFFGSSAIHLASDQMDLTVFREFGLGFSATIDVDEVDLIPRNDQKI